MRWTRYHDATYNTTVLVRLESYFLKRGSTEWLWLSRFRRGEVPWFPVQFLVYLLHACFPTPSQSLAELLTGPGSIRADMVGPDLFPVGCGRGWRIRNFSGVKFREEILLRLRLLPELYLTLWTLFHFRRIKLPPSLFTREGSRLIWGHALSRISQTVQISRSGSADFLLQESLVSSLKTSSNTLLKGSQIFRNLQNIPQP